VSLLDQDEEALSAARETVEHIPGLAARTSYFLSSVRTLLRAAELQRELGQFEFIYSMGLFDYLTRPVARAVLARLYELLAPGGAVFVGNYHVHNPSRYYMAYWLDWNLHHRSEREFVELAAGLGGAPTVTFDPTGAQMFLTLEKPR
jgi:extracellular factor (EF) 3-hydroxypalmitic acid methyl ester biosynthesis protein